jgi:hypothetical protein
MRKVVSLSAGFLFVCVLVGGVDAQDVWHTLESANASANGWFGYNCEGLGDVDGLGCEDIGVAATYEDPGGTGNAGMGYVFSGETGDLLYELSSPNSQANGEFGWVGELGDVTGDGCDDFMVCGWREAVNGLGGAGRVYVYSGATGDTLYSVVSPDAEADGRFGTDISAAGDVDNDGYPDFAVGAWGEDHVVADAGQVHIFSGATGAWIRTLGSPNATTGGVFGASVGNIGDANGDGWDDLVVGAWGEDPGGISNAGMAYIFSGATGDTLHSLFPPDPQSGGEFGLAWAAGDVNGDGYGDAVVGAATVDVGYVDDGRAYVFSGLTGGVIHALDSPNPKTSGRFGLGAWGGEDYNNDGYADVVVGAAGEDVPGGVADAGMAYVFSGATGQLMVRLSSPMGEGAGNFGYVLGRGADVNGDGTIEVIVAAPLEDGGASNAGRVYVFDGSTVPIELASFRGHVEQAGVRLAWVTLTEQDNLGFNVERASAEDARYARLNESLIPGAGTTTVPHTYSYLDDAVQRGCTYWYRLEDVSLTGERAVHGPIQVVFPSSAGLALSVLGGSEPAFALTLPGPGRASLALYNVSGRLVARLWEGQAEAGVTVVRPPECRTMPEGMYTAILSQQGMTAQRNVVIRR